MTEEQLDQMMVEIDGTDNKSRLGANAILGVSLAVATPNGYELESAFVSEARQQFTNLNIVTTPDPAEAVRGASA